MCGRYVSSTTADEIAKYFGATDLGETLLEPNYNVAPTSGVYVVHDDPEARHLDVFRWGLVPRWAKDMSIGNKMINARSETAATKNAFRYALSKHRCIIPADGFYEWQTIPGQKAKQPVFIHRVDGDRLAFAGLWETWKPKAGESAGGEPGEVLRTCTILTCAANSTVAPVHDRMPVLLSPEAWDRWLDPDITDIDDIAGLLIPAPPELLTFHPVSTEVNNVRNRGPHLMEPAEPIGESPLPLE